MNAKRPEALDGAGDVYHVSGKVWRRGIGQNISRVSYETGEIFSPCAAAAMYLRSAFLEAGGFDESFFCYMEDVDLGFRLRLAGHKCLFVYDAVARHEGSASSGLHSDFYVYHGARNMVWTFMKNMPAPLLIMYLPQHLLLNLFTMLWYALQGKGGAVVRAKRDSIAGLPRVLEQRKRLHKRRAAGALALRKVMAKGPLKPYLSQIRRERLKNAD